jgi:hypothetical protein
MSLELLSTIAAVGTFVVIAATAIAAIIQLRHLRSSNQISAIGSVQAVIESAEFEAARRFIQNDLPRLMKEPHFAERAEKRVLDNELAPLQLIGNVYESLGIFCKYGIIDKAVACDLFSGPILSSWTALIPFLAIRRRRLDAPALWENFEFLAVLCEDFEIRHPDGAYPKWARRINIGESDPVRPPQTLNQQ